MKTLTKDSLSIGSDIYTDVLMMCLYFVTVPGYSFSVLRPNQWRVSQAIKKALQAGHIRRRTIALGDDKTRDYYSITMAGLRHLMGNPNYPWLSVSDNPERLTQYSGGGVNRNRIRRMMKVSAIGMVSIVGGASMPSIMHPTVCAGGQAQTFSAWQGERIREWLGIEQSGSRLADIDDAAFRFVDGSTVKELVGGRDSEQNDYRFSRIVGMLDSPYRCAACYQLGRGEIWWPKASVKQELSAAGYWRTKISPAPISEYGSEAILFYETAYDFKSILREVLRKGIRYFGSGYARMHAVPISHIGAKHLGWLMQCRDEEIVAAFYASVTDGKSGFVPNERGDGRAVFPVCDESGKPYGAAFPFDLIQLRECVNISRKNKLSYGLFCYDWQAPLLRAVLPEVDLVIVS